MTPARINLTHLVLDMDIGGLQRLITDTTLAMNRDIYRIQVCCMNRLGCFAEELRQNGIEVTLLQKNQERFDLYYPWRLRGFLRKKKVHILHMHPGAFIFGALAAWLARTPASVYTEHGRAVVEDPVRLAEDRIAGRLIGKIVAVSAELERSLIEKIKLPARKISTIINGVSSTALARRGKPQRLLDEFHISDPSKVIGTVGRLDDIKDQLTMIKAFQAVTERIPDSKLILVGEGPERQALSDYIEQNNLSERVILAGSRDDIPDLLNLFDLFVLSSLSEGTSISLLEAMASGVPPVVTDVGGNPSVVEHGTEGLVVKPKDVSSMADAMIELLTDSVKYEQFSTNAVEKVRKKYSIERMVESYTIIYMELLRRKREFRNLAVRPS
jgi:sugar transferase (PEP-CTERM/EpsH1 system associated)